MLTYFKRPESGRGNSQGARANARVAKIKAMIDADPAKCWKVGTIAQAHGVCRFYLGRIFKAATGSTVKEYALGRKVRLGQKLLREDVLRATKDIAAACGFRNESHFSRVFHKVTGETPGGFRRRMQAPGGDSLEATMSQTSQKDNK